MQKKQYTPAQLRKRPHLRSVDKLEMKALIGLIYMRGLLGKGYYYTYIMYRYYYRILTVVDIKVSISTGTGIDQFKVAMKSLGLFVSRNA